MKLRMKTTAAGPGHEHNWRPGDVREIPDKVAKEMVASGIAEEIATVKPKEKATTAAPEKATVTAPETATPTSPPTDLTVAEVAEAIGQLDKEKVELWTADGKPQTKALADVLGRDVSAAMRDEAWIAAQKTEGNQE